jgi:hypothetical protein
MKLDQIKRGLESGGKRHLIAHMEGKRLSLVQMVKAKCYECMNAFVDGRQDCGISDCPLYPRMPFNTVSPHQSMRKANPNAFGRNKVAPQA